MIKQIIVMRTDLKMQKGKMIAQGAHASLAVFFNRRVRFLGFLRILLVFLTADMRKWVDGLFTKVCVRVGSERELLGIYEQARISGLPCVLITDAGKTEFHGVPTHTCCAIGPAKAEDIDPITGSLRLL